MIKPIHNENDYKIALERVEALWGAKQDTPAGDELDVLLVLIEGYENKNHQMPPSDPVDAIHFLMDQMNLTRKDLEAFLGPKSRVSDVLNRKRHLTLPQIVKLHKELHIPYESLIEERYYL
ncbi:transcriptional regulator [Legionella quinlivanii]|uniref:Transcriptional regulator n=1 Tax=Legionella quinlivanii TaxID=45073 RepID=A0A364LJU2_9GAMM|nr:transcriptional regulator [Legionella quinlivanii]RAP36797.1 transcriptional regulator [Legionella quinlivanii]